MTATRSLFQMRKVNMLCPASRLSKVLLVFGSVDWTDD
jgi:hypothetical protein